MTPFDQVRTTVELNDLGAMREDWAGILSPMYADDTVMRYIHSQFLEEASQYVNRYQAVDYWTSLLRIAVNRVPDLKPTTILDIGSGAGNTIFGLLDVFPDAFIVASDLSVPLLKVLKDYYTEKYSDRGNCAIVQLNAEDLIFEESQFDLVVGGAILHHLFDPRLTLAQCYRVLKPGGCALFFEPFEIGYQLTGIPMTQVLRLNEFQPPDLRLPLDVEHLFKAITNDIHVRKGSDKSAPIYQEIDDKWLFTQQYFQSACAAIGFTGLEVYPLHAPERQFSNQIGTFLRLGLDVSLTALPQWAKEVIVRYDDRFSTDLLPELIIEGCIIMRK